MGWKVRSPVKLTSDRNFVINPGFGKLFTELPLIVTPWPVAPVKIFTTRAYVSTVKIIEGWGRFYDYI